MKSIEQIIVSGSSLIVAIQYDPTTHGLEVDMVGGKVYSYLAVPIPVWGEFKQAESKGQFYNRRIKGKYSLKGATA